MKAKIEDGDFFDGIYLWFEIFKLDIDEGKVHDP